jgi:protein SCO1/2
MRTARIAAMTAALLAAASLAACGSSSSSSSNTATTAAANDPKTAQLDAPATLTPTKAAPDFTLRNSHGENVTLSQFHGKAVLLTFIYAHCPDVCPLIVSNLHNALAAMGPDAEKAQVVAVSVDPKGDTAKVVNEFITSHEMTGKMEYLIGSKKELTPVWKKWGVAVQATPDAREVDHSAFVYGITGSGQVTALYPSNLKPAWIVHDVPLLAAR